tara:strand:+ start:613 stop:1179 length:567 start_codon:yes stop_codon:yes gene_type:complete
MKKKAMKTKDTNEYNNSRYDEMKSLLDLSRSLFEQIEVDASETEIEPLDREKEQTKEYSVSNGKVVVHAYEKQDLELTSEEQGNYQETMDDFIDQVSDLVDFNRLNIYDNTVEWSGKLVKFDLDFFYAVGEENGVYLGGNMMKLDDEFVEMLGNLKDYYKIFTVKWANVLANRKSTKRFGDEEKSEEQ